MAKIVGTTCCGLKELVGADEFDTPFELVKFVARRWIDTFDGAFLIFSFDTNRREEYLALQRYILKKKLGNITEATPLYSGKITAVWGIERPRLLAWAGRRIHDFPFVGKHFKLKDSKYANRTKSMGKAKTYPITAVDIHQKIVFYVGDNGLANHQYAAYIKIVNPRKPLWKKKK